MRNRIKSIVIVLAIIIPILGWIGEAQSQSYKKITPPSPFTSNVVNSDTDINTIHELINEQRQVAGLSPLALNDNLNNIAGGRCNDMVTSNYYAHYHPGSASLAITPLYDQSVPGWKLEGENIDAGLYTPQQVVSSWMNSPDHRANIIDGNYNSEGLAVCESNNFTSDGPMFVYVEDFAQL